ncbi:MAG: hypothetical protein ACKOEO_10500 [Planctomycetaceae bacterium]
MAPIAVMPIAVKSRPAEQECRDRATNHLVLVVLVALVVSVALEALVVAEPRREFLRASCCRVRFSEIHLRSQLRKQISHCHLDLQVIS